MLHNLLHPLILFFLDNALFVECAESLNHLNNQWLIAWNGGKVNKLDTLLCMYHECFNSLREFFEKQKVLLLMTVFYYPVFSMF